MATPKYAGIQQARNGEILGSSKINNSRAGFAATPKFTPAHAPSNDVF
jgi:hypothetical protein